jgi:hypothetical protein
MKRKWVNQEEFLDGMLKARNEAKEMEVMGREMSYSEGYSEGYKRGLEVIKWNIENELKKVNDR